MSDVPRRKECSDLISHARKFLPQVLHLPAPSSAPTDNKYSHYLTDVRPRCAGGDSACRAHLIAQKLTEERRPISTGVDSMRFRHFTLHLTSCSFSSFQIGVLCHRQTCVLSSCLVFGFSQNLDTWQHPMTSPVALAQRCWYFADETVALTWHLAAFRRQSCPPRQSSYALASYPLLHRQKTTARPSLYNLLASISDFIVSDPIWHAREREKCTYYSIPSFISPTGCVSISH